MSKRKLKYLSFQEILQIIAEVENENKEDIGLEFGIPSKPSTNLKIKTNFYKKELISYQMTFRTYINKDIDEAMLKMQYSRP